MTAASYPVTFADGGAPLTATAVRACEQQLRVRFPDAYRDLLLRQNGGRPRPNRLGPDLDGFGGADGSLYQLAVFGDVYAEVRFQWWSVPPPQWQPLVGVANEMIQAFLAAGGWGAGDRAGWPES